MRWPIMSTKIRMGNIIRTKRKEIGMTQEELAEKSNLSINYISRIERNINDNISVETLMALSGGLNLSPAQLLGSDSESNIQPYTEQLINYLSKLDAKKQNEISKGIMQLLTTIG